MKTCRFHNSLVITSICFTGIFGSATGALAETESTQDDQWHFELTPYLWASGQSGDITLGGRRGNDLEVNQSFSNILERLELGGMLSFDARYNRWGILLDAIYFKISDDGDMTGPAGLLALSGGGEITQELYSVAGYYRAIDGKTTMDMLAGARYNSLKWDVDAEFASPVTGRISKNFSEKKSWTDPYIGIRAANRLNEKWTLSGYADVGGMGAGSDLSWQALAGFSYAFRPDIIGKFGYRYTYNDYKDGDFHYDMSNAGIYAGVGIRW